MTDSTSASGCGVSDVDLAEHLECEESRFSSARPVEPQAATSLGRLIAPLGLHETPMIRELGRMLEACGATPRLELPSTCDGSLFPVDREPVVRLSDVVQFDVGQWVDPFGNPIDPSARGPSSGTVTVTAVDRDAGLLTVERSERITVACDHLECDIAQCRHVVLTPCPGCGEHVWECRCGEPARSGS